MNNPRSADRAFNSPHGSLVSAVIGFCRFLDGHGIAVPPGGAELALRALREIDITARTQFRRALQVSLLKRPEDIRLFTELFEIYWRVTGAASPDTQVVVPRQTMPETLDAEAGGTEQDLVEIEMAPPADTGQTAETKEEEGKDVAEKPAYAARWGARLPPTNTRDRSDAVEIDRIARALAREFATRRSRRKEPHRRGKLLDHRALMRKSLRYGGVPISLSWRRARVTRAKVVFFCDVSRSMQPTARLLLQFASAVLRQAWRVEVFLFASRLVRVTSRWSGSDWTDLARGLDDCGGGTRIGETLDAFVRDYEYCLAGNEVTTIILSDGLDAGEPERLARVMEHLNRRSRRVIWLNPLLSTEGYEPTARGMAAALPYIDVFGPAGDVACFWQLVRALRGKRGQVLTTPKAALRQIGAGSTGNRAPGSGIRIWHPEKRG